MISVTFDLERDDDIYPMIIQFAAVQMGINVEVLNAAIAAGSLPSPPDLTSGFEGDVFSYVEHLKEYESLLKIDFSKLPMQ